MISFCFQKPFWGISGPFYKGSSWNPENSSDSLEVMKTVGGSAGIWPQVTVTSELTVSPLNGCASSCPPIHSTNIYLARTAYQVTKVHALMGRHRQKIMKETEASWISPGKSMPPRPRGRWHCEQHSENQETGVLVPASALTHWLTLGKGPHHFVPLFLIRATKLWTRNMISKVLSGPKTPSFQILKEFCFLIPS